jgi:hypothetical protein
MAKRSSLGGVLVVGISLLLPVPFVRAQAAGAGQRDHVRCSDGILDSQRGQQERVASVREIRVPGAYGGGGEFAADGAIPLAPRDADFVVDAPGSWSGSTCGAGNDCPLHTDTEDVMYEIILPEDGLWSFSLCGSDYDTYIFLGTDRCTQDIGYDDDFCGLQSQLTVYLTAGHYFLTIEGYCCSECGNYLLNVYGQETCDVTCPPGAMPEPEPCGEDTNGGCNHTPHQYSPIACGQTECGTVWANYSLRDTDWYEVTVDDDTRFTWSACAEFIELLFIIAGPEDDYQIVTYTMADPYSEAACSADVPAGTYWLWMGPGAWYDLPCEAHYVAHLDCTPLCMGAPADVNGDGIANNYDITPFVHALTHTQEEFHSAYPEGHYGCADANADGYVDNFDISPFVAILTRR